MKNKLNVEIGNFVVTSKTDHQFEIHEKSVYEKGDKAGQEKLDFVGFYPRIDQVCSKLLDLNVKRSDAKTLQDILDVISRVGADIYEAFEVRV